MLYLSRLWSKLDFESHILEGSHRSRSIMKKNWQNGPFGPFLGHFYPPNGHNEPQWAKIDPHFQKICVFTAKSFGPKLFGYCNPILGHAPGHWDALIWRNCENGSNICPKMAKNGQKWPFLMRQCLFTCKLFSTKVPGHHSLIHGQHSRHSDALIRHICENGPKWSILSIFFHDTARPMWTFQDMTFKVQFAS